jgi:Bacterial antitoxin of type II TA system, VapB
MRMTVTLDDELVAKAQRYTGLEPKTTLVREAFKALIERESARRLARLGGSQPGLRAAHGRQGKGVIFGLAKGQFEIGDDIDGDNLEIDRLFNGPPKRR